MTKFTEIIALKRLIDKHAIKVEIKPETYEGLKMISLKIANESFTLFIQDEYDDLKINNPSLHLCLALKELEIYDESIDFLQWSSTQNTSTSNTVLRSYYMGLNKVYQQISNVIGSIHSQISDLDFQLNAGAAQELRLVLD